MNKEQKVWIRGLLGTDQRQAMDDIADNYSPLLINISNDMPGRWGKRKGSVLLGDQLVGGQHVQGLITYEGIDGTTQLRKIAGGSLWTLDTSTDTWNETITNFCDPDEEISSVNFKNRTYHIGINTYLKYVSSLGTSATEVGTGSNRIKGNLVATAQNTLFVAGKVGTENRIYYSKFNLPDATTEPNQPTDQLWEDQEKTSGGLVPGTLSNSSRYFIVNGSPTAMLEYEAINNVVVFTNKRCYSFDLSYSDNALGPKTRFKVGCCGSKAITVCNDWLVWMDSKGRIQAWGGAAKPTPISWEIEDDEYGESFINNINKQELFKVAAGSIGNKFYFSVGDVSYRGTTYNNVLLKGFVTADFQLIIWGFDTTPYRITHFENFTIDGEEMLCAGCEDGNVYWYGVGNDDDGIPIHAQAYTKFYDFRTNDKTKLPSKLLVKYRPQPTPNTYLTIKYAIDGDFNYIPLSTPDDPNPVVKHGVIDMNKRYSATKLDDIDQVNMPTEAKFRSLSILFENSQLGEDFEISQFGFSLGATDLDRRTQS